MITGKDKERGRKGTEAGGIPQPPMPAQNSENTNQQTEKSKRPRVARRPSRMAIITNPNLKGLKTDRLTKRLIQDAERTGLERTSKLSISEKVQRRKRKPGRPKKNLEITIPEIRKLLRRNKGLVAKTARDLNCTFKSLQTRISRNEELKELVIQLSEENLDRSEEVVLDTIDRDEEAGLALKHLERKGRHRGWSPNFVVAGDAERPLNITITPMVPGADGEPVQNDNVLALESNNIREG